MTHSGTQPHRACHSEAAPGPRSISEEGSAISDAEREEEEEEGREEREGEGPSVDSSGSGGMA